MSSLQLVLAATVVLHQMLPRTAATMTNVSMTDVSVTAAMMVQLLNCGQPAASAAMLLKSSLTAGTLTVKG